MTAAPCSDDLATRIPTREWQPHSCGPGAKAPPRPPLATTATHGEHRWLLIRRHRSTGELAFSLYWSPRPVAAAYPGPRGRIPPEHRRTVPDRQGPINLDHHQIRSWTTWHRFITLAMLARTGPDHPHHHRHRQRHRTRPHRPDRRRDPPPTQHPHHHAHSRPHHALRTAQLTLEY